MIEIIKTTVEYQHWGLNVLTLSALGTIFFTLIQAWSILRQNAVIWRNKSGESVSVIMFSYWLFYFSAFTIYGWENKSIAMMTNGMLFLLFPSVLLGLFKFKKVKKAEKIGLACFAVMPIAMSLSPASARESLLFIFLFGILIFASGQPYEVWRNENAGNVEPRMLIVFMATNIFWFVFGIAIGDLPLMIFNPLAFLIFAITFWLWKKYKIQ